jgi:hypothetical protein
LGQECTQRTAQQAGQPIEKEKGGYGAQEHRKGSVAGAQHHAGDLGAVPHLCKKNEQKGLYTGGWIKEVGDGKLGQG